MNNLRSIPYILRKSTFSPFKPNKFSVSSRIFAVRSFSNEADKKSENITSEVTTTSTTNTNVKESNNKLDNSIQISKQAPNRDITWSRNQRKREEAMVGPRFEQTDLEAQPRPLAAIELIAEEPIHYVEGRIAVCHGGGGPLGHPQIYINLDQPGPNVCGYCGLRFEKNPHHHH
ncbi:hypothetical protein Glove_535g38 [Diversispora epigaea]|uniref:Zinc finger CHCC-type domain-containing protein n=1 Tax=Diversispora epigaea TaxID=1348612 RepID=A0A397GDF1_9GLOM|nr:hypothetical protein Glove_535g38 [Diversispora epigaea]